MKHPALSRRALLRGLGATAALAPFVPYRTGRADESGYPTRLILVFSGCGTVDQRFWPTGTTSDFTFPDDGILKPLEPFKDKLILANKLARTFEGIGGNHERGIGGLWTGVGLNPGNQFGGGGWPKAASVDQVIADEVGKATKFRSIELAVQPGDGSDAMQRMCYRGSDQPIDPEIDPLKLFDRLFGEPVGLDAAEQARIRAERQSVLDLVRGDLVSLENKLSGHDKERIGWHLESLSAVEKRLQDVTTLACTQPGKPEGLDINANENFPLVGKLMMDLLVPALACDLTRVVTLQWSRAFSMTRHTWVGVEGAHHDLSHDTGAIEDLFKINRWYAEQFAYLLAKLDSVPEGDGTLLDHSIVVWGNELNEGSNDDPAPPPFVLAGGANGFFKTGRYLEFDGSDAHHHNQLLVSLCNAMGMTDVEQFGEYGPGGPLSDLG